MNLTQEAEYYKIHVKLDVLRTWQYNVGSPHNINNPFEDKSWNFYGEDKKIYDPLYNELKWTMIIRILVFSAGSVLLIIPKFMNPIQNNAPRFDSTEIGVENVSVA